MADRNLEIALRIKADLESARKQLDELSKSVKATGDNSKASADKLGAVGKRIGEMEKEAAAANKTLGQTDKVTQSATGSTDKLGRSTAQLARNLASGNFEGAARDIASIGAASGSASAAAGVLTLGLGSVVAVLGLLAVAAIKGYQEDQALARSIIATGNYAGVTTGQVRVMAEAIGGLQGDSGRAQDALRLLIESGRVAGDNLQKVATAAVDFSTITGNSIEKSVQVFLRLQDDPVRAVKALDDQFHFLTLTQYQHIKALQDQGDMEGASAAAQEAASVAVHQRALEVVANTGLMERAWNNLRSNVVATWNAMKDVGATKTAADDLAAINKELDRYRQRVAEIRARHGNTAPITDADLASAGEVALSHDRIAQLLAQKQVASSGALMESWIAKTKSSTENALDVLKRDDNFWNMALASAKSAAAKQKEINAVNAAAARDTKLAPNLAAEFEQKRQDALALIDKKYAPKTTTPRDNSAAVARAANAAMEQQIQTLIRMQAALDPTSKAWATYNAEVTKQDKLAAAAKSAPGADVAAIDARRNAIVQMAAATRDADLENLANKDREAFERLRDSLLEINGISLSKVKAEIAQLDAELRAGTITPKEHSDTVEAALNKGLKPLPTYQGVDATVGGPFGELDKVDAQKEALQAAYTAELNLLNQQHDAKLRSDESFIARENALFQEHANNLKAIDDARTRVMLMGITSSLSAGAAAIKQGFGEQSAAYRAAFALQKGAAIAMATVNMYLDISQAAAKGWPVNIPLIAQAIGEGLTILGGIHGASFATGGYTGAGGKYQPAGIVHAGEYVQPQARVSEPGALAFMQDFHRQGMASIDAWSLRGYASGGFVSPLANVPAPPALDMPKARLADGGFAGDAKPPALNNNFRFVTVFDVDDVAHKIGSTSQFERDVVNVVARNSTAVSHALGR
ncbi:phage tail length tape measure family protein [Rhodanobacter lindaniclasticus]